MHALRATHQRVVEKILHMPRHRVPADLGFPLAVLVALAAFGGVVGADLGIEGPVRQVHAVQRVGQGLAAQVVGRPEVRSVPLLHPIARAGCVHRKRQQALGPDDVTGFFERHQRRRPAEIAGLGLLRAREHADGLAVLALDRAPLPLPAARAGRNGLQRSDQIVFDDLAALLHFIGRLGAAEGADQRLLGRVPLRLAAAGGAGQLLLGGDFAQLHGRCDLSPSESHPAMPAARATGCRSCGP